MIAQLSHWDLEVLYLAEMDWRSWTVCPFHTFSSWPLGQKLLGANTNQSVKTWMSATVEHLTHKGVLVYTQSD